MKDNKLILKELTNDIYINFNFCFNSDVSINANVLLRIL